MEPFLDSLFLLGAKKKKKRRWMDIKDDCPPETLRTFGIILRRKLSAVSYLAVTGIII